MKYYIFSDLHIGDPRVDHAKLAAVFMNIDKEDIVIVNGDGIEDWTRDYRDVISDYYKVINLILKKTSVYVVGNHDSVLKPFCRNMFEKIDGRTIAFYYPFVILSVDGKKWYIEHGHLCGKCGRLFKFLDRFDDTKIFRDIAKWIASRKCFSGTVRSGNKKDNMKKDIALKGMKIGADVVIVGHDHLPIVIEKERVLFVNPGTAINKFTYIVYENGKFEIVEA